MKSFIVLGLGKFGRSLAKTLYDLGYEVLAVDDNERIVQEFSRHVTNTVQADFADEEFLKSMDIKSFDAAIVAVGSNIQISIMTTVLLKELGAKFILVKAQDDFQEKILYKLGADNVILPEKDIGIKTAQNLVGQNIFDIIEVSSEYGIVSIDPPASWFGQTLSELSARKKYGINIIAVNNGTHTDVLPGANTIIEKNSIITVIGTNHALKQLSSIA